MKRDAKGRAVKHEEPLARFVSKCEFDPRTGCVIWTGGKTSGRGHSQPYGSFWYEGRRWFAHRWAARFIHGQKIDDLQVDHCCPCGPRTLCVQHVQAVPPPRRTGNINGYGDRLVCCPNRRSGNRK